MLNPENTIIQGDCNTVLKSLRSESVDLVLTDPPYGVRYMDRSGRSIANDSDLSPVLSAFTELYRVLRPDSFCISFYGWNRIEEFYAAWRKAGFHAVGHVVWVKSYASRTGFLRSRHEQAYLLAKGRPAKPAEPLDDIREWEYTGNRIHPTEKAVSILEPLIESFSRPNAMVLDPFAGSGSTLLAAKKRRRRWLGIELDDKHCASIRQRLGCPVMKAPQPIPDRHESAFASLAATLGDYERWLTAPDA